MISFIRSQLFYHSGAEFEQIDFLRLLRIHQNPEELLEIQSSQTCTKQANILLFKLKSIKH